MENEEVGQRIAVYWPQEDHWFEGIVTGFERDKGWRVEYDDGDEEYLHSLDASHVRKLGTQQHDDLGPSELRAFHEDSPVRSHAGGRHRDEDPFDEEEEEEAAGREGPLAASLDNFSPLPVPRVDHLHRLVEKRQQPLASDPIAESPAREAMGGGRHRRDYFSTEEEEGLGPEHRAEEEEEEEEDEQGGPHEPGPGEGEDEVALLQGEVPRATGLPGGGSSGGSSCFFARVLYTESSGANVMFACKTTVHQTEPAACSGDGSGGEVVWEQAGFRFELLAPAPGEPIVGELIFAVFESHAASGTTSFVGQAIIDLASAGGSQADKRVEGAFPLRTRKGSPLPSGQLHLRLHVRLPPPLARAQVKAAAGGRHTASSSSAAKPPRTGTAHSKRPATRGTTGTGTGTARRTSSRPPSSQGGAPRKANHAFVREREQDRIARANKFHMEKLAKYKKAAQSSSKRERTPGSSDAQLLAIDIPRQENNEATKEAPAARMLRAQQEVAAIKDRLKLLGAKLVKIEAANRRSNIKAKSSTPSAGGMTDEDENREPNRSSNSSSAALQQAAGAGDAMVLLGLTSFSEEALDELEGQGSVQVGVYRDLMARRKAWQSRIATFQGEWRRSDEAVKAVQERIEEAERARRALHQHAKAGGKGEQEDVLLGLQARAQDLRVEVQALKTARELKLANGDLEHEMRVLQGSLDQGRDMITEKKERLKAVQFDRDSHRHKYEALSAGQTRDKLSASVNALQLALVVLSKQKDWGQMVSDGMSVEAEAAARTVVAAERRALVTQETLMTIRQQQQQQLHTPTSAANS